MDGDLGSQAGQSQEIRYPKDRLITAGERLTRNGRDAAVVISVADLSELEETIAVLSDPEALADIREADAA